MAQYILSCDSTADISAEHLAARSIEYNKINYILGGIQYRDDHGLTVPYEKFYADIASGVDSVTSQSNIQEYADYFTPFLEKGLDVVHIGFSSGLSGTLNSARNAAALLKDSFPERTVYVVDSLAASGGYGLLMDDAADRRDEGLCAEELVSWVEENRLYYHHWFFSTDLSYYVKGGRISKASAVFGGMLEICPLMDMDAGGHLVPRFKIRTKKRVIKEIANKMAALAENGTDYSGKCFINHSNCLDDCMQVVDLVEQQFPQLKGKVLVNWIGTSVGAHTGPGTVALFFRSNEIRK